MALNSLLVGLELALLCDENGGQRNDSSVNARHVPLQAGNVGAAAGLKSLCCSFGTDTANRLARAHDGAFVFGNNSFTIGCYIWQNTVTVNNPNVAKWEQTTNRGFLFEGRATNSRQRFTISDTGSNASFVEAAAATPAQTWIAAFAGYDKENEVIWCQLAGQARNTVANTTGMWTGVTAPLSLGWYEANTFKVMGGDLQDETWVWSKVLDTEQVDAFDNTLFFSDFDDGILPGTGGQRELRSLVQPPTEALRPRRAVFHIVDIDSILRNIFGERE